VHLKLVRSGGLAGLDMLATVESTDLPTDQQGVVTTLLTTDLKSPPGDPRPPGGADQFSYQLEIRDGEHTVKRHWQEFDVPDNVRPLLASLTRQAKPLR